MNKYKLIPIPEKLQDNDWNVSTYKGNIEVCAEDENDARLICFEGTVIAAALRPGDKTPYIPWQQERLVTCELIEENYQNKRGVISPKEIRAEWLSFNNSRK